MTARNHDQHFAKLSATTARNRDCRAVIFVPLAVVLVVSENLALCAQEKRTAGGCDYCAQTAHTVRFKRAFFLGRCHAHRPKPHAVFVRFAQIANLRQIFLFLPLTFKHLNATIEARELSLSVC